VPHFEDALAFCREAGYRPELAWTCYDYANALLEGATGRSPLPEHRTKAMVLLAEAMALSQELGMRPLVERVNSLGVKIDTQRPRGPKYPAGLTERQVQVLRLIGKGKTNREIAKELELSDRTVQRHIADIYAKICARNRVEATVFTLSQLGLTN
jgi:DNA-binding NarL/FixJ family response regulator